MGIATALSTGAAPALNTSSPGLLEQYHAVLAALQDARLSRGDLGVFGEIVDRFFKSKGNSRASLDLLSDRANLARRNVIKSVAHLVELGYITVLSKGRRGRATEYLPRFSDADVTETNPELLSDAGVTLSDEYGDARITKSGEYGDAGVTPTFLRKPADKQGLQKEGSPGARSAPSTADAPGAAATVPPRAPAEGFEEFWAAYPLRYKRPDAKAAYAKLAPSPELHALIVERAAALRDHHAQLGTAKEHIPWPSTWLTGERWLEDLPPAFGAPKPPRRAAAKRTAGPATPPSPPASPTPMVAPAAARTVDVEIVDATVQQGSKASQLCVSFRGDDGHTYRDEIVVEAANQSRQEAGQQQLGRLVAAAGFVGTFDSERQLVGRRLRIEVGPAGNISYPG